MIRKIIGYCSCCGEPHYENEEIIHDPECIWYEGKTSSDGADLTK